MATNLYGADVGGVAGVLAHRDFTSTTEPSDSQVEHMLHGVEGEVAVALAAQGATPNFETLPDEIRDTYRQAARFLVEVGAAAAAELAAHPEDTGPGSLYAALLTRYQAGLTSLPQMALKAQSLGVTTAGPAQTRSTPAIRRTLDAPWLAEAPPSFLGPNPRRW